MPKTGFRSVDEYIGTFPENVQFILETVRQTVQKAVPEAEEVISYNMHAFKFHGPLLYFSAYKNHYSLFGVRKTFKKKLSRYQGRRAPSGFPSTNQFQSS